MPGNVRKFKHTFPIFFCLR